MKRVSLIIPSLFSLLLLLSSSSLFAQQGSNTTEKKKIVIIKKQVDKDGTVIIEKIVKEGDEADQLIHEIHMDEKNGIGNAEIDIEITGEGGSRDINIFKFDDDSENSTQDLNIEFTDEDGNKIIKMRRSGDTDNPEIIEWQGQGDIPAEVRGKLDELGIDIQGSKGMHWISAHGDHGKQCNDKAFLGVVLKETVKNEDGVETREGISNEGVIIDEVVAKSAAEAAGLKEGDVITAIDGQAIRSFSDLTTALGQKKPDDKISINYIRSGQASQTDATLKAKTNQLHGFKWDNDYNFNFNYDYDYDQQYKGERPCVFIGVYVNSSRSRSNGAKITGIIEDTPASVAQLQGGDLITAINDVPVRNYSDLLTERNKYNPGDQVNLTISRDGAEQNVDITFKECGEKEDPTKVEEQEVIENTPINPEITRASSSAKLELENFRAFPNPTAGEVTVRFSGEAVPTTISVVDISGRSLFSETLNNFDGDYNNRIDLTQAPVGTLLLTVRQGDQIFTQTLVRSESTGL